MASHPAARGAGPPSLDARAWTLIDARTGRTIVAHNAAAKLEIASTTKLMTAYLALQRLPLGARVRMAAYTPSPGESLLRVPAGTPISVRDLLYGLILRSGNDAALTLARAMSGSEERFVAAMNRTALALGLIDTRYQNPIGLDAPGNYSSARDLASLGSELIRMPVFARIADSRTARLGSLDPPRLIRTRNTLLMHRPWVNGVKTGHTSSAGYVLVASGRRKGVELVSAVLGVPAEADRDADSLRLLDYGFSLYRVARPVRRGQQFADPSIRYTGGRLPLLAASTATLGVRRSERIGVSVSAPSEVSGPIQRGARLGRLTITIDGHPARSVPLLASRSIARASAFERLRSRYEAWAIALVALAFVILIAVGALRRSRGGPKRG